MRDHDREAGLRQFSALSPELRNSVTVIPKSDAGSAINGGARFEVPGALIFVI